MRTFFDQVLSELMEDPYFHKFKFRKRDSSLNLKTNFGRQSILLEHWSYLNLSLIIRPLYEVRFDVLCRWFEKFSCRTLSDQRDDAYVGFTGDILGKQETFDFSYYESGVSYKNELKELKDCIIECSKHVFEEYSSLEVTYQKKIKPILEGKIDLPIVGAEWFFYNLTLCKIIHPEKYDELKYIHLKRAKEMYERNEPNMSIYYPRMDEILTYMENQKFKI